MKLNPDSKVRYSEGEKRLFALLGKEPLTSTIIAKKYYGRGEVPYHSRKIIIGLISSLQRKTKVNRETVRVAKSERKGPYPIEVWLEDNMERTNGKSST